MGLEMEKGCDWRKTGYLWEEFGPVQCVRLELALGENVIDLSKGL